MKLHSPRRTYNQGDRCYIYHTLEGVTQKYTLESLGIQKGVLYPSLWKIVTPRVWRLDSLDVNGIVYSGDTVFVENTGYKNTSEGVMYVRGFQHSVALNGGIFSEQESIVYEVNIENNFIEDFGRNTSPSWNRQSNSSAGITFVKLQNELRLKVNIIDEPLPFLEDATPDPHRLILYRNVYNSWSFISTPNEGTTSSSSIIFHLTGTAGDFQYFTIKNVEGVLSVQKHPLNVYI